MLNRRHVGIGLALGLSALAITPLVVTGIERLQARATADLLPHDGMAPGSAQRPAVVFYSRSGNTALLARHLARRLNAGLYRLEAQDYALGLLGWANALRDAQNHEAHISVPEIDLSAHDTIYLGSPIWMFSPAPPLWQFIASRRFDGKQVVLVNTFNSRFKPEFIEQFRPLVLQRGALSFEHRFVRRAAWADSCRPKKCWTASMPAGALGESHPPPFSPHPRQRTSPCFKNATASP